MDTVGTRAGTDTPLRLDGVVPYPEEWAHRYRSEGHWADQTHAELLAEAVRRWPDRTAVVAGGTETTYADLGAQVLATAAALEALGVGRGDRVVVQLPNSVAYLAVLFAVHELGAVAVPAVSGLGSREVDHVLGVTGATVLVTVRGGEGMAGRDAAKLTATHPALEHVVVLDVEPGADGTRVALGDLLTRGTVERRRRGHPGDVAFLQLSGGTTGQPKLIPHTHEAYLSFLRNGVDVCGITGATVQLAALPLPHGLATISPGFLSVVSVGGTLVLAPNGSPDATFPLIELYRVTDVSLVPPLALAWLSSSLRERYDLSSLEVLRVGGAKLGEAVARRVRAELGVPLQQSFGMAEGLATFTRLGDDEEATWVRQGRPISPADEIRVVDAHDEEVPRGTPGDLLVRGPQMVRGYYKAPEENARAFGADGFYRTGDVVVLDDEGYLTVVGRSKDQINRGGEKIAPVEVENVLLGHEAVHDAAVVGVPDEVLGERIKAYLIPREGTDAGALTLVAVRRHLREQGLASYKLPDVVELVTEFRRTAVGKVRMQD